MAELHVSATDGRIELPNGGVIGAVLTPPLLASSPALRDAREWDAGTRPFMHYDLRNAGTHDGRPVLARLSFHEALLLRVHVTVSHYPPEAKGWESYSLEIESAAKACHDELCRGWFDGLARAKRVGSSDPNGVGPALEWSFDWGTVGSYHDDRGGDTFIGIAYGNRLAEAQRRYRRSEQRRDIARTWQAVPALRGDQTFDLAAGAFLFGVADFAVAGDFLGGAQDVQRAVVALGGGEVELGELA